MENMPKTLEELEDLLCIAHRRALRTVPHDDNLFLQTLLAYAHNYITGTNGFVILITFNQSDVMRDS